MKKVKISFIMNVHDTAEDIEPVIKYIMFNWSQNLQMEVIE